MQLKFLLIFNDLYQPFFKLGNKTAKQITNLPIFLSFFVMALSVLQISFETRNYSVLKNYPHFTNPQIINKFETLYLQFHDTHEERKIALTQKKKQAKSQLIQEHDENEKLFIDFYKYLKTSTPSYPTIFHQIQSSILKEDTINLYKSFEQIAPILVSEIKKEFDQKNQIEQVEVEPIQHLQIDFPYKNWTTQNETFNEKKEKLLISWEFDNSDIVIKDLKKEKHLDKASLIIHQFLCQYENYLKAHEKEKEILVNNTNIQSPEINWSKFFINLFNPVSKQAIPVSKQTSPVSEQAIPVSKQTSPVSEQTSPVSEQTSPVSEQAIPVSEQAIPVSEQAIPVSEQAIPVSEQEKQIPSSMFPIRIESVMERKMREMREEKERKENEKKKKRYEKLLKKREYEKKRNQIPRVFEKKMLYTPFKPYLAYPKIHESMTKLQRYFYFKSHDKTIVPEAKKARGLKKHEFSENQWQRPEKPFDSFYKKQWKRHKKLFHSLQARLPLPYESINWLDPLKSDYFNQIKKINDQIPRKIEGFQELNSQQLKPCPFIFRKSGHQYQKRKVIKVHFNKQKWNNLVSKINNLVVEYPPSKLWEVCTAPTYKIDKVALYPWKYRKNYGIGYLKPSKDSKQKLLFDFLKLLVDHLNVKYYAQIVHVLKQVQYDNIKHFAKFDVEWVEFLGEGPRALERKRRYFQVGEGINPKTIYQKELGFKLKSIEDRKTERYVNKVAPLKRDPLIFPLYKFQRQEGKYVLPSSESDYFSSIINPYAFFLDEEGEHDLDADVNFQKWREKKNTETFDFYLNNSSPLLKFKNENSYLDELIYAEDYLLETISDILKRNNLNSDFIEFLIGIEFEEEDTEEESEEDEEFEEEEETGASAATSLTFDFIKNRKKQRRLFFQNNQNLVEMKDIFKQKRKLDFSFLYEMFLPNFKLFENKNKIFKNYSLEKIQKSTKDIETVFINEQEFSHFNNIKNFIENFSKSRIQLLKESYAKNDSDRIEKNLVLPKIPHDVSSPALVIPKNSWKKKKNSYPFKVIDLKELTPNISKKIKRTYQMLPLLSDFLNTEADFNETENGIDFNETENGIDFNETKSGIDFNETKSGMEKFYNQFLTYINEVYPDFLENTEDIYTTFDDLFKDLVLYELHRFNKKNKKNEKNELPAIYQFLQRRQMSGYLFPDLENWPSQRKPQKNLAPLSQKNLPISTDRLQARSFRYQAHSIEGRQFFEFREKINNYSWSLLFFFSSGWVFVNIFKNVYKKYAKEIVESGIDFLERAGILDDVKWLKEELGMSNEQAYRGIRHQGKKFKNIIGLERKYIILQLSEMVWFLKTQKFRFLNFFQRQVPPYLKPKGFLFIGPPGTGKTLLVQALAGETGVPVVTQSGGLLQNPRLRGKGAQTLHKLFLRAREIAPCIIFIDEVDGIGSRRQFLPDGQGGYDAIEFLENHLHLPPPNIEKKVQRRFEFFDDSDPYWKEPEFTQTVQSTPIPIDVLQDMQSSRSARNEQVSILTQLLIELDGLHPLDNILVIGATNRVEILDPALMRPGRFQRILKFNLPDYNARINLLKLYTQSSKIGIEDISWDYFSKRTQGLSSADIASIVFSSELTAIQLGQKHTFASLERGIDLITSFPSDPVMLRLQHIFVFLENSICKFFAKNQFYFSSSSLVSVKGREISALQEISNILRNCYYNIGKMFIVFCLQLQPLASINLWERPKNFRFLFFTQKFNEFDEFEKKRFSRIEIEKRLLAFFGGKAGESLFIFLPLHKFSPEIFFQFDSTFLSFANSLEQSNFGIENEIQRAQSLLKLMVEKWYFYLEKIATEKFHPILEDVNLWEYREKEILLAQALVDEMIIDLDMRHRLSRNEQKHSYQAWWMKKVATQLNFSVQMGIGNEVDNLLWSRIYLSDPDNSAQNIEWVAPDEFFHTLLRTPPFCMPWTQFLENGRFAISNLLLLQSFNTVFKTLRQFPEFIDFLADYFLRQKSIRETVFQAKISQFFDGQI